MIASVSLPSTTCCTSHSSMIFGSLPASGMFSAKGSIISRVTLGDNDSLLLTMTLMLPKICNLALAILKFVHNDPAPTTALDTLLRVHPELVRRQGGRVPRRVGAGMMAGIREFLLDRRHAVPPTLLERTRTRSLIRRQSYKQSADHRSRECRQDTPAILAA